MQHQLLVDRISELKMRQNQLKKTNELLQNELRRNLTTIEQLEQNKVQAAKTIDELETKLSFLHQQFQQFQHQFEFDSEMKFQQMRDELKRLNLQSEEQLKIQEKIQNENDQTFAQVFFLAAAAALGSLTFASESICHDFRLVPKEMPTV